MDRIRSEIVKNPGYQNNKKKFFDSGKVREDVKRTLDEFIPGQNPSDVDIIADDPSYKNINDEQAAKMMGYFTQKMESEGFPWKVYKPKDKGIRKKTEIGEFEALQRLRKGEAVILQPKRVIGIGFDPQSLKGKTKDIYGKEGSGQFSFKTGGMEVKFGEPIKIDNYTDLKFLHDVYNPNVQVDPSKDPKLKVAARQLAYFTKGTMNSQHPWKMIKPHETTGQKIKSMIKGALAKGVKFAGIGAGAASLFSIPAIALGATMGGPIGIAAGAAIGAGVGIIKGARSKRIGKDINAIESLARLNNDEPVYFQEMTKREIGVSVPFPIGIQLGSLSFYGEHGEGSTINNLDEFHLFNKMQEQQ
ncbi:MAG: hypothetical protein ACLFQV_03895 [Vulcanimicrobiota bacterium]